MMYHMSCSRMPMVEAPSAGPPPLRISHLFFRKRSMLVKLKNSESPSPVDAVVS